MAYPAVAQTPGSVVSLSPGVRDVRPAAQELEAKQQPYSDTIARALRDLQGHVDSVVAALQQAEDFLNSQFTIDPETGNVAVNIPPNSITDAQIHDVSPGKLLAGVSSAPISFFQLIINSPVGANFIQTPAGSATAGTAAALPGPPAGYITFQVNGSSFKFAFYNV